MGIFDNHFHLRPSGRNVEAAREFEAAGGTAILLTHSPYDEVPIRSGEDYERAYGITLSLADVVRRQTRLQVFVALGPYPVDLVHLARSSGIVEAERALDRGLVLAAREVREGRAVALGEVGRPHFDVPPDMWDASNRILQRAMETAKDVGCAVVVHSEDPTQETFREFAAMARRAGLSVDRVVKHHSPPSTEPSVNHGVVPSILAKDDLVSAAIRGGGPFLMETDYIDDLRRPGAVLGPGTVPRKTRRWLATGLLSAAAVASIHGEIPARVYGISTD